MYRYRNILAIISLMMLVFGFLSCAEADEGGFLRVLEDTAEFDIIGERNGVPFSARISIGEGGGSMTFASPESMKGIKIMTSGEVWGGACGGVELSGEPAHLIGAPLEAFLNWGEVVSAEKVSGGTLITARSDAIIREYLIDSGSGLPLALKEKSADGALIMEVKIENYTIKEGK